MRGGTPREIRLALAPLLAVNLTNTPGEWELAMPIYVKALNDIPVDLLREAVIAHIRSSEWFPKPVHLRALIHDEFERRKAEVRRLETELDELRVPVEPERIRVTAEQAASVLAKYGIGPAAAEKSPLTDSDEHAAKPMSQILAELATARPLVETDPKVRAKVNAWRKELELPLLDEDGRPVEDKINR